MKRFALILFVVIGFVPLVGLVLQIANYQWVVAQEWYYSSVFIISKNAFLIGQALMYIYVIGKNKLISDTERRCWRVLVFLLSPITAPIYNFKYLIPFLKYQNAKVSGEEIGI